MYKITFFLTLSNGNRYRYKMEYVSDNREAIISNGILNKKVIWLSDVLAIQPHHIVEFDITDIEKITQE